MKKILFLHFNQFAKKMTLDNRNELLRLLQRHKDLGISDQIDYEKFYLYSIITHSTVIEGSTVTEVEAQLLFDEGITSMQNDIDQFIKSSDKKMVDKIVFSTYLKIL